MGERQIYNFRASAVRAAREHCKKLLGPAYEAHEGPDYEIHPYTVDDDMIPQFAKSWWREYAGPAYYILRGPAKEKLEG